MHSDFVPWSNNGDLPAWLDLLGLQLDWPSIAGWAYASIFAVTVRFQIRDQFWIPQPKLRGACILEFLEDEK